MEARSQDVIGSLKSFRDLHIEPRLCDALQKAGYSSPSPVQEAALPHVLAGTDVLVQAKSGTGKTLLIACAALRHCRKDGGQRPQVLVTAPTREIAVQTRSVVLGIAEAYSPFVACHACIGGLPIEQDYTNLSRRQDVVVGTPGRLCSLLGSGHLDATAVRAFALDEVDALLAEGMYPAIATIYEALPHKKQVVAVSATLADETLELLLPMLKRPQRICVSPETVSLEGVHQLLFTVQVESKPGSGPAGTHTQAAKAEALRDALGCRVFSQALVFCNEVSTALWLTEWLQGAGVPAVYISSRLPQAARLDVVHRLRTLQARVAVASDVLARGVDLPQVSTVFSIDVPRDAATHMHRVGRSGRFGRPGLALSLLTRQEGRRLRALLTDIAGGHLHDVTLDGYASWDADLSAYTKTQRFDELAVAPEPWRGDQGAKAHAALQRHAGGDGSLPEWPAFGAAQADVEDASEEHWSRWWRHQDDLQQAYGQLAEYVPAQECLAGS